jgi:hypothetical protein
MCPLEKSVNYILFIKMMKTQNGGEYSKDILLYLILRGHFFITVLIYLYNSILTGTIN